MTNIRWRNVPMLGVFVVLLAVATACGSSNKKSSPTGGTTATPVRIDSQFVFGGTPECQERDLCLGAESQRLYGFKFKEVRKLDEGGPITSKALKDGTIQVGELFTGSSVIDPDFVLLKDDKGLQPSDNPIALIRQSKATDDVKRIIDAVNAKLTLDAYNKMSTSIDVDKIDPKDAATSFLKDAGLDTKGTSGKGISLKVGAKGFAGARAISEAYAIALQNNGYDVSFKDNLGQTEVVYKALQNGDIDLYGEYQGTLLTFLKGSPTADRQATYTALQAKLQGTNLVATTPAEAQDVNGFYVTKETATKYSLVNMSDLTKTTTLK